MARYTLAAAVAALAGSATASASSPSSVTHLTLPALAALAASASASADLPRITFLLASDVHFGHDVVTSENTTTTSVELNIAAVEEMNRLPGNASWPEEMGGGIVGQPLGLLISGDLIDNGGTEWPQVENFTRIYGLTGTDGMLDGIPVSVLGAEEGPRPATAPLAASAP